MVINPVNFEECSEYGEYFFKCDEKLSDDMKTYYVNDKNKNILLFISKTYCLFYSIEDKKSYQFLINDDFSISQICLDGVFIKFSQDGIQMRKDNIESSLFYYYDLEVQDNGYDGKAVYTQYNVETDTNCRILFPHMYRNYNDGNRPKIYGFNLDKMSLVYIDHKYSKTYGFDYGFTMKNHEYYLRQEFEEGNILYNTLGGDGVSKVVKYAKSIFISPFGRLYSGYPIFNGLFNEDELKDHIVELGFSSQVPEFLLELYNNEVEFVKYLSSILTNIKEQSVVLSKK